MSKDLPFLDRWSFRIGFRKAASRIGRCYICICVLRLMWNEQFLPNLFLKKIQSRIFNAQKQLRVQNSWANWLGWKQWLVLFGMGITVILVEIRNHNIMWQEHQSGQTILTDHMLLGEIIVFGLFLPIISGIVLAYTGRTAIERDKMAKALKLRRGLIAQMHEAESWNELADLVVTTAGKVTSANRAWLLAQRSDEEEFDQIAHWQQHENDLSSIAPYHPIAPTVCEQCTQTTIPEQTKIATCHYVHSQQDSIDYTRYCLWLASAETRKTALLIDVPQKAYLDIDQIKILEDLSTEMSLAIENANLNYAQKSQVDLAKNERLRIAQDLHDTLGQNISYLRLKLEQLSTARLTSDPQAFQDELTKMLNVADEAYGQVRGTLEELRTLEHSNLEETIRAYAMQSAQRAGFSVSVHSSGQSRILSVRKNRQIMYIVHEALNNVEKHAHAQHVEIHLQWGEDEFRLTVIDNGQGFDLAKLNTEDRYGMVIMRERSRNINAEIITQSTVGQGTEIILCLPLPNETGTRLHRQ